MSRICYNCMQTTKDGDFCNHCGKKQVATPSHHLVPGTILNGKYTLGNAIGEGGFGITYVGMDTALQIKVAIKEFYPKGIVGRDNKVSTQVFCVNQNSESLFITEKSKVINEARILAKFSKEQGIVNVRDYFEANNTAYIVMEYLEGETLEDYLKNKGTLSPKETFDLLYPVMRVVELLHKENVVHRDISPDNLMFDGKQLKLLDFGAAREVLYSTSKSFSVILKHGFAPEEQYRRKGHQGPWTDIYALCATMYFCMTGEVPDTSLDRLHEDELKPLSEYNIDINKNQELAMNKGLSVLLEGRFKKISEFVDVWNGKTGAVIPDDVTPNRITLKTSPASKNETVFGGDADYVDVNSAKRFVIDEPVAVSVKPSAEKKKGNGLIIVVILLCIVIFAGVGVLIWKYLSDDKKNDENENPKTTTTTTASGVTTTTVATTTGEIITSEVEIDNFKSYLEEADALVDENKFDEAIDTLETAKQLYGDDERVEQKIFEIGKKKGVFQIKILVDEGDYLNAILFIDDEMPDYNSDEDIVSKRAEFVIEYRKIVIEQADKALEDEGYVKAIEIINEALDVIGEDQELDGKISEYEEYKPVSIKELVVTSSSSYDFSSSEKDPREEINENVLILKYMIEFYTGGKYSTFTARLDPTERFLTSQLADTKLYIYADDELVYSSPVITYKTDDLEIEVDIKNADYIKFKIENVSGTDWQPQDVLICDGYVSK